VKIREAYLWFYARPPSADELRTAEEYVTAHSGAKRQAYEDLLWALLNTKEFLFNH
jgi:hypothetical protein